jgi:Kef-type K+ transport system membrane component KefB
VLGAGAVGELGPVLVVSLILTHEHTTWQQTFLLLAFAGVALAAAIAALQVRLLRPIVRLLARTLHVSRQLPVRICVLLIVGLVFLAHEFGLDLILGAFAAGMVVRLSSEGERGEVLREKLEAIGYGFLVPLFFVVSGIKFNLGSLLETTDALLRVPFFVALFLLIRGCPSLLFYRKDLAKNERLPFVLYISTALPLIVAITDIGVATRRMRSENAAALVGAGMVSVLLFPLLALALRMRSGAAQPGQGRADDEDAL